MTLAEWMLILMIGSHLHKEITGQNSSCVLPRGPPSRLYCPVDCRRCSGIEGIGCHLPPGTEVTQTVTRVECSPGYRLEKDDDFDLVLCARGRWTSDFQQCLAQCPPLESDSVFVRCRFNGREVGCNRPMMPRTSATFECRQPSHVEFQELAEAGAYRRTLTCRFDGRWSHGLPECKPVCGLSKGSAVVEATIKDGLPTKLGVFPWHAGLYKRKEDTWEYICGGSLLTKHVVLTAAHCVIIERRDLRVTFAKVQREWEKDESETVKRTVSAISVPREFSSGANTLAWDIALLLLSDPVQIDTNVMPVCRDVSLNLDVTQDSTGYVVGWGSDDEDHETDVLQHNDIEIKLYEVCSREIPKQLASDKFCGSKKSVSQDAEDPVVQHGDSGGGLTVVHNHQHYILGIVSLKYNSMAVFTNVSWFPHWHWINTELNKFLLDISRCPAASFYCSPLGSCLDSSARCDGNQDCPDGSDEDVCPPKQVRPEFDTCLRSVETPSNKSTLTADVLIRRLQFSLNLFSAVHTMNPGTNVLISPAAVYNALRLAYLFSYDRTEMELKRVLHLNPESRKLDVFIRAAFERTLNDHKTNKNNSDSSQLNIATRAFVDRSLNIKDCVLEMFDSDFEQIDFNLNPTGHVNRWMDSNTHGLCNQLEPNANINPNSRFVIANSVYFKGSWKSKFKPEKIKRETFYESSTKMHFVDMMRKNGIFNFGVSESLGCHIMELLLENSVSMFIFLPPLFSTQIISRVIKQMDESGNLLQILDGVVLTPREFEIAIPRFSFYNKSNLVPVLAAMGVRDLFSSSADLSILTGEQNVHLNDIVNSAGIELGPNDASMFSTSRSARSTSEGGSKIKRMFICNHPFIYLLVNERSNILLAGIYQTPPTS